MTNLAYDLTELSLRLSDADPAHRYMLGSISILPHRRIPHPLGKKAGALGFNPPPKTPPLPSGKNLLTR